MITLNIKKLLLPLLCVTTLSACGGSENDTNTNEGSQDSNESEITIEPTLASIQENVFTPTCAQCHSGASAASDLKLDTLDNSVTFLIDVSSVEAPNLFRVATSDADNSYIIQKLEGTAAEGGRMPLNRTPLSDETIATIKEWINAGAPLE